MPREHAKPCERLEVNSRGSLRDSRGAPTESARLDPAPCKSATDHLDHVQSVDLLESLVRIPSPSRHESAAVRFLVDRMNALGLCAFIDGAGNAVGTRSGGPAPDGAPTRDIVLLGHIDTVPGDIPVRREGDRLFGRGAVDAKGPLCAFVAAAASFDPSPGARIIVIGAVEEECETSAGARFAAGEYSPAACIIGEPSGVGGVTIGYKGCLRAEMRIEVPAAHSAGREPTAAELAADWWTRIRDATPPCDRSRSPVIGASQESEHRSSPASGMIGGTFHSLQSRLLSITTSNDGITDRARALLSFRLPPGAEVDSLIESCRASAPTGGVIKFGDPELAVAADRNNAVVRALTRAIRDRGARPVHRLKTGTSDWNVVAPHWPGCPTAAYGPGDSALDHTPDEHILIPDYLRAIGILRSALGLLALESVA